MRDWKTKAAIKKIYNVRSLSKGVKREFYERVVVTVVLTLTYKMDKKN